MQPTACEWGKWKTSQGSRKERGGGVEWGGVGGGVGVGWGDLFGGGSSPDYFLTNHLQYL